MKKAILLLCLILQTIMVSAQYNNENSFMRRVIIGYELRSDGYPDDFPHSADDAYKNAQGGGEAKDGGGYYKASFLNTQLHGKKTDEVGKKGGERQYQDGLEEGEG